MPLPVYRLVCLRIGSRFLNLDMDTILIFTKANPKSLGTSKAVLGTFTQFIGHLPTWFNELGRSKEIHLLGTITQGISLADSMKEKVGKLANKFIFDGRKDIPWAQMILPMFEGGLGVWNLSVMPRAVSIKGASRFLGKEWLYSGAMGQEAVYKRKAPIGYLDQLPYGVLLLERSNGS